VDTYAAAVRLNDHLSALASLGPSPECSTVVVVGAGFTGIEVASEMPGRLAHAGIANPRVILIDPNPVIGATMGESGGPVVNKALSALGVETRLGVKVNAVEAAGVALTNGEFIPTRTVVWCAGMKASPLAASLAGDRDRYGRLAVDQFMRAIDLPNVFAAGDVAVCKIDGVHATVMSCQFARPMGRFAGHNVAADLFGKPMLPLHIDWYVTVLDLGAWGALYTVGWDRQVSAVGSAAKATKQIINHNRIYPPRTGRREDLLAAAAPTVQAPPPVRAKPS
jgi:NADH dehydrogenase